MYCRAAHLVGLNGVVMDPFSIAVTSPQAASANYTQEEERSRKMHLTLRPSNMFHHARKAFVKITYTGMFVKCALCVFNRKYEFGCTYIQLYPSFALLNTQIHC